MKRHRYNCFRIGWRSHKQTLLHTFWLVVIRDVQFWRRRARARALWGAGACWGQVLLLFHGANLGHGALHLCQAQQGGGPAVRPGGKVARRAMLI